MLKKLTLLFVLSTLLTTVGVAQEDGWVTLPAGQSVYSIRYDQNGAIVVNNNLVMGCTVDPQSPDDTKVYISPPSPLKKYVLVMCWDDGGRKAYVIDTRNGRAVSRDVVPKHWHIIKWISWSPDERFALVAAGGEITMGDMAFIDIASGRSREIEFKNFTNNRGIDPRETVFERIQDFDPDKIAWLSSSSFRLNMDVRCNPYEIGEDCYEKVISSHPVRVNLNPFSISYVNTAQASNARVRQSPAIRNTQTVKGIRSVDFRNFAYRRDAKRTSNIFEMPLDAKTIILRNGKTTSPAEEGCEPGQLMFVKFVDFGQDGQEEAVVAIHTPVEQCIEEADYFVFAYRNGTPVQIFHEYRFEPNDIRVTTNSIVITAPFWRKNDVRSSPSATETSIYQWRGNGFVRIAEKLAPAQ